MNLWQALDPVWSPQWLWLSYATLLRASVFLALAALAATVMRRAPSAVRAGIWASALIALLPLPNLRTLPWHWSLHLVPEPFASPMIGIGRVLVRQSSPAAAGLPWTTVVAAAYLIGVVLVAGWLLINALAVVRLAARSVQVRDEAWLDLLDGTARELGIRRRVRLLRSNRTDVPVTWGTLRPAILLPATADDWSPAQRRAVLLHELAHVNRLDAMLGLLGYLACALWWFHPGAWLAARRLRSERELACDERVLLAGVRPSDYAECLMRVADGALGRSACGPAIVAAGLHGRSDLHARVKRILAPRPSPRSASLLHAAAVCAVVMTALGAGSMRLAPHPSVLWRALASHDWATRAYAAESIARFGDASSLDRLGVQLHHERHGFVLAHAEFGTHLRARQPHPHVRLGWPADRAAPQPATSR